MTRSEPSQGVTAVRNRFSRNGLAAALAALLTATASATAAAAPGAPPEIRISNRNQVPACVTPGRLMRFLTDRNPALLPKFRGIAQHYKEHGARLRVRWDYAFFQMILETNYLTFRNASGPGDVKPTQNNFAGIGTTGGGVPGDSFPDVSSGVLGQMQHLVAYSGERVVDPVARRTREKQDDIISVSQRLGRAPTFRDLAGRWAVDRRYWQSITFIADLYATRFCNGAPVDPEIDRPASPPQTANAREASARPSQVAAALVGGPPKVAQRARPACKVFTASYGGAKNVLIRHERDGEIHFTALQVLDGQEQPLADAFIRSHAPGGQMVGEYANRDAALTGAFNRCPAGSSLSGAR